MAERTVDVTSTPLQDTVNEQVTKNPLYDKWGPDWFSKYVEVYAPVRAQEVAFYERLILLVTGTIALTMTAVVNKFQNITHRYTLRAGFISLVAAVVLLLSRNFTAMRHEKRIHDAVLGLAMQRDFASLYSRIETTDTAMSWFAAAGVISMLVGFSLLLFVTATLV